MFMRWVAHEAVMPPKSIWQLYPAFSQKIMSLRDTARAIKRSLVSEVWNATGGSTGARSIATMVSANGWKAVNLKKCVELKRTSLHIQICILTVA